MSGTLCGADLGAMRLGGQRRTCTNPRPCPEHRREEAGLVEQPPIPERVFKIWGHMSVLCPDHKEGPTWHHREYHCPPRVRLSFRLRLRHAIQAFRRELRQHG